MNINSVVRHAFAAATTKARHKQHRLAAIIIKGGSIIATGHNSECIHAEESAINRSSKSNIKGCTLVVLRVRRNGTLGLAKPCQDCMGRITIAGIKKVLYTDENGIMQQIKLNKYMDTK